MKGRYLLVLMVAVVLALDAPGARQHPSTPSTPQRLRDSVDSWTRENYRNALDLLLPDSCASPIEARWLSCILIVPSFQDEPEYWFSVEKQFDGKLSADIVRPKGHSIYAQLRERKREHPRAALVDLAKLIEIESRAGDQSQFPGLKDLADKFEGLRLSPVLSDEITMDPSEYRFRIRSFAGETMEVVLNGPGSAAAHQSQPLIRWAESAKESLAGAFH